MKLWTKISVKLTKENERLSIFVCSLNRGKRAVLIVTDPWNARDTKKAGEDNSELAEYFFL